jgi:hypothetical protein
MLPQCGVSVCRCACARTCVKRVVARGEGGNQVVQDIPGPAGEASFRAFLILICWSVTIGGLFAIRFLRRYKRWTVRSPG